MDELIQQSSLQFLQVLVDVMEAFGAGSCQDAEAKLKCGLDSVGSLGQWSFAIRCPLTW